MTALSELIVLLNIALVGGDFLGRDSFVLRGGLLRIGFVVVIGILIDILCLLIDMLIILVFVHILHFIVQLLLTLLIFLFF